MKKYWECNRQEMKCDFLGLLPGILVFGSQDRKHILTCLNQPFPPHIHALILTHYHTMPHSDAVKTYASCGKH